MATISKFEKSYSDVVHQPMLCGADSKQIYVRLPDSLTVGSYPPVGGLTGSPQSARSRIVTSGRIQIPCGVLKKIVAQSKTSLPQEFGGAIHTLFNGDYPHIISPNETRDIVLWGRSSGSCEARFAAVFAQLFVSFNLSGEWAVTVSKRPYTLLTTNAKLFEQHKGEMQKAAFIPSGIADLLYLRGEGGELAFPGETDDLQIRLSEALNVLFGEKMVGQSLSLKSRIRTILSYDVPGKTADSLGSLAKKMLPHYKLILALLESECEKLQSLPPLESHLYDSLKQFTEEKVTEIVECSALPVKEYMIKSHENAFYEYARRFKEMHENKVRVRI